MLVWIPGKVYNNYVSINLAKIFALIKRTSTKDPIKHQVLATGMVNCRAHRNELDGFS